MTDGPHWYAGRSQSEVATSLGVDRKTIKKEVCDPGDRGRYRPGWAGDDRGGLGRAGRQVIPGSDRHAAAADDLAANRDPP